MTPEVMALPHFLLQPVLTARVARPTLVTMDLNDIPSSRGQDPLVGVEQQDLAPLSVEELRGRIARLKEEMARTEARLAFAQDHRTNADALFRKN